MARVTLASNVSKVYASILFLCPSGQEKGKSRPLIKMEGQVLGGSVRRIAKSHNIHA